VLYLTRSPPGRFEGPRSTSLAPVVCEGHTTRRVSHQLYQGDDATKGSIWSWQRAPM